MFNSSGIEICHPNPQKIGKQTNPNESFVRLMDGVINTEDFYDLLKSKKQKGGLREFKSDRSSEIIYLYPVENTDWIIAAHANIDKFENHIQQLKDNFFLMYLLTSVTIVLLSLFTVRYLGNYYESKLELKNEKLTNEVINLSKLNSNLQVLKNKVALVDKDNYNKNEKNVYKSRLLAYLKDKLISVKVDEIAFINTEHSITTITCLDGKKKNINSSLEELSNSLDPVLFFRVNRQNIISVKGISEILKYGNNQLKIITNPTSKESIIISKIKLLSLKNG